ncbi:hypothetical protein EPN81_03045 [Patescibacteria group bacterium]|nr:MAG: hypothetical protein EPN81_03045 [Patescibacteria group bacterium]
MPGYFAYSYSGDSFRSKEKTNLAGSVFALKLYAMLGEDDATKIQPIVDRIVSFQQTNGMFCDPFIARKRLLRHVLSNLRRGDFHDLHNQGYIRAESRQAFSALLLYGVLPEHIPDNIPTNQDDIRYFLSRLDWSHPWGAGSHFSHLLFFLSLLRKANRINETTYQQAQDTVRRFIASLQQEDGAWYTGNPSQRQKINGAMKVISGLIVDDLPFDRPDKLIDLCLAQETRQTDDACDQINQILVLRYSDRLLQHQYRQEDIQTFCRNTLGQWSSYYHPLLGGFSFHKGHASRRYYGAKVSQGLNEPDIHGTVLFVWGLSMMNQIFPLPELDFLHEIKS